MGRAARDLEPFDDAYAKTDWSRFRALPAFEPANRINAYGTYLRMEQEALDAGTQVMADVPMIGDPVLAVAVRAARRAASRRRRRRARPEAPADVLEGARRHRLVGRRRGAKTRSSRRSAPRFPTTRSSARSPARCAGRPSRSPYKWIVEPIDGSANFAHGFPYYAVSIALAHGTEITHAVVLDPVHDELFTAVRGKGAQLNGAPIRVSACTRLEDALVGTVFPTRGSAEAGRATCRCSTP